MTVSAQQRFPVRGGDLPVPLGLALGLLLAASANGQTLKVYSEFRRITPGGEVAEPDRAGRPREIISPAIARQAFASFRIVVSAPAGKPFALHLGENPENAVQTTLYREHWTKEGAQWVPDRLEKVAAPFTGVIPDPVTGIPSQRVMTFWLDIYAGSQAPVRRIRVEAQLNVGEEWVIYPLEVRVQNAVVPKAPALAGLLVPLAANAAEPAMSQLDTYLCAKPASPGTPPNSPSGRLFSLRNAQQDAAMMRALEAGKGRDSVVSGIVSALGMGDLKSFCAGRAAPSPYDPDAYLRVRDFLNQNTLK